MVNTDLIVGGGIPFVIGAYWVGAGVLKWSGLWKRWYRSPPRGGKRLHEVIGPSPLPELLAGLSLCVAGGSLFASNVSIIAVTIGPLLGSLLIVVGAVFLMYRPKWINPAWMSESEPS